MQPFRIALRWAGRLRQASQRAFGRAGGLVSVRCQCSHCDRETSKRRNRCATVVQLALILTGGAIRTCGFRNAAAFSRTNVACRNKLMTRDALGYEPRFQFGSAFLPLSTPEATMRPHCSPDPTSSSSATVDPRAYRMNNGGANAKRSTDSLAGSENS
jgi:hypothetical protein